MVNRIYYEVKSITTSDQANNWIAPWPSYLSNPASCTSTGADKISCPIPINTGNAQASVSMNIDLRNKYAQMAVQGSNTALPSSPIVDIVYPTKDGIGKIVPNNTLETDPTRMFGMTLIPSANGAWGYILSVSPLENSMFTRLYYLDGNGLSKFKKYSEKNLSDRHSGRDLED